MSRIARAVVPGLPHHVTQRGNRRQQTFFHETDYATYLDLMQRWCTHYGVEVWAYCLMPNHVHLIAVPEGEKSLASAMAQVHKRYSWIVNEREGWRGHLWQERFASFVMDETHLLMCARYVEMNPVRAGLVEKPEEWPWSSARTHLTGRDSRLVNVRPLLEIMGSSWSEFLLSEEKDGNLNVVRAHEGTGRPLGSPQFLDSVEQQLGRVLRASKRGRRRRSPKPTKD